MPTRSTGRTSRLEEQRREAELARSSAQLTEQRLRIFAEVLRGLFFIIDERGQYFEIVGSEEDLLAAPRDLLLGHTVSEMLPTAASEPIMQAIGRSIDTGTLQTVEYELSVPLGRRFFQGRICPLNEPGATEKHVAFLALDVTEQHTLGEQLRQSQKMEAIGRLAGGVAHDFNNMLTAILGFCDMALETMDDPAALRLNLDEIGKAALRASGLTRQLLAFSRRQVLEPKVIDMNEQVVVIEKMLRRLIGEHVQLTTQLCEESALIRTDPGQIDQVLINLAVNARDAMPRGGKLTLRTSIADFSHKGHGPTANLHGGKFVVLEVIDTGEGMDEPTLAKVFEPFFTTKERDKGTGLGLSTVYGIVKQSGGDIVCESAVDIGTTIRIYFPVSLAEEICVLPEPEPDAPAAASGTILVVEDDDSVRELLLKVLEGEGYSVLGAPSPMEALEIIATHGRGIELMITDIVMPGMSGRELVDRLAPFMTGLKVLYISGYTDGEILELPTDNKGIQMILKPFHPEDILSKVRLMLQSSGGLRMPGERK